MTKRKGVNIAFTGSIVWSFGKSCRFGRFEPYCAVARCEGLNESFSVFESLVLWNEKLLSRDIQPRSPRAIGNRGFRVKAQNRPCDRCIDAIDEQ